MLKTPLHLRLEKFSNKQLTLFMVLLCERMYPNFAYYCNETEQEDHKLFLNQLNLVWESLLVKNAKINFDGQVTKLEEIVPEITEQSPYIIYAAIDACEALGELLHSFLTGDILEHAIQVSRISLKTVIELESEKLGRPLSDKEQENLIEVQEELDIQWDLYRLILSEATLKQDFISDLKQEIRALNSSNIGVFLSN